MKKYKINFYRDGLSGEYISRSIPWDSVMVLFIMSDLAHVYYKKNKNRIRLVFQKPDHHRHVVISNVEDWRAKEIKPMELWNEGGEL